MRLAALVSGGKDSALALNRVLNEGHQIAYIVSLIPKRIDSWMFHYPNIKLTALFAKASEFPYMKHETTGVREEEVEDLRYVLSKLDVDGVVSGAITSEYQRSRIEKVCKDLNIKSLTPLWHQKEMKLLKELVQINFEVIIVGVYAYGFTRDWLGKTLNTSMIENLADLERKYQISPIGEGGEYETLVLDAPYFKQRIQLIETEKVWEIQSGYLHVKRARLSEK